MMSGRNSVWIPAFAGMTKREEYSVYENPPVSPFVKVGFKISRAYPALHPTQKTSDISFLRQFLVIA